QPRWPPPVSNWHKAPPVASERSSDLVITGLLNSAQDLRLDDQENSVEHLQWSQDRTRQANFVHARMIMTSRLMQRRIVRLVVEVEPVKRWRLPTRQVQMEAVRDQRTAAIGLAERDPE